MGGPHHQPTGASLGEQRGQRAGSRGGNIPAHWLGQSLGCDHMQAAWSRPQPPCLGSEGCLWRAGAAPLLALRPRGWGSAGICPSAPREVVDMWPEGLSVGLGPASMAEEWIPAGERGSTAPHRCHAGASRPLPAAGDKDTNEQEEWVLAQCLAGRQSVQPGQGVLAGAVLRGAVSPVELWERAVPGFPSLGSALTRWSCLRGSC